MQDQQQWLIPVAAGELIDKITILEIKLVNLRSKEARANVALELNALQQVLKTSKATHPDLKKHTTDLVAINRQLWNVEDQLRLLEKDNDFSGQFIMLARSVYKLNDQRSTIKRHINTCLGSRLVEEKSYGEKN